MFHQAMIGAVEFELHSPKHPPSYPMALHDGQTLSNLSFDLPRWRDRQ